LQGLGGDKYLSIAIPGKPGDMMAYDAESIPALEEAVDFWNVMSYDAMNRRDSTAKHHAGAGVIKTAVEAYTGKGRSGRVRADQA
jgi:chitinase